MKTTLFSILFGLTIFLIACTPYKINTDTQIIDHVQGHKLIRNKKENLYILYAGDFWFHPLKKSQTLNWNQRFIESISWDKHPKELLFAGHTTIEPYCSSLGLLYHKAKSEEIAKGVAERMRKEFKAQNVFLTKDTVGIYFYTVLSYQLKNEQLDVEASYKEYYSDENEDVLRLVFWSMESGPLFLDGEIKNTLAGRTPDEPEDEK